MNKVKFNKVVAQLPEELEPDSIYYVRAGAGVDVYVTNSSGVIVPMPTNQSITYYNSEGKIGALKCWVGETISDDKGVFNVDWSSAGFSQRPLHVSVTTYKTVTGGNDRTFCSMSEDYDKDGGIGYTMEGAASAAILVGGGAGTKAAKNVKVTVMAWGI